ncbi:hypothetical protein [Bradyrhizobium sp. McL0616]|uniref:hypothetical protein n=1 Tax=Bradyrhizobium sp. McL0616 TaxID=3415674 RepID=UPI003CE7B094
MLEDHKRLWELYDEIVMLLAADLGLDIGELTRPIIEAGGGWTFLLHDLIAKASPITNSRALALLKEYDAIEAPYWTLVRAHDGSPTP